MKIQISKKDFKDRSTNTITKLVQGIIRSNVDFSSYEQLSRLLNYKIKTLRCKVSSIYLTVEDADDLFEMEIPNAILSNKDLTAFQKLVYGFKYSFKSITSKRLLERFNEFGMFQNSIFRKQVFEIFTDGRVTFHNIRWKVANFETKDSEPIDNTTQDRNDWKSVIPAQESASIESTSSSEKELLEKIKKLEQSLKEKDDEINLLKVRNRCLEQESREQTHKKNLAQKETKETKNKLERLENILKYYYSQGKSNA